MTQVQFAFKHPDGDPFVGATFTIRLQRSGFIVEEDGVVVPETITAITGQDGTVIVELQPSSTPYLLVIPETGTGDDEDYCGRTGRYKFYVPISDAIIRAQDLLLAPVPNSEPWDETALQMLTDAKVAAMDAAARAADSEREALDARDAAEGFAATTLVHLQGSQAAALQANLSKQSAATSETHAAESLAAVQAIEVDIDADVVAVNEARDTAVNSAATAVSAAGVATTKADEAAATATLVNQDKVLAEEARDASEAFAVTGLGYLELSQAAALQTNQDMLDAGQSVADAANQAGLAAQSADEAATSASTSANAANAVRVELATQNDPTKGAGQTGWDGQTVGEQLDQAKKLANYTSLRNYTGRATGIRITQSGIAGYAQRDATVTVDNGGTTFLDGLGRGWRRVYSGPVEASWFEVSAIAADCAAGILAAVAEAQSKGGGLVKLPSGVLKCTSSGIAINPIAGVGWQNINFEGEGSGSTILDFTGSPANSGGITVYGWGGRVNLKGFTIKNAQGVGLEMNPVNRGSGSFVSRVSVEDIIVNGSTLDGLRFTQTYMCSFRDIESINNGGYGFNLRGSHTSMTFNRCWGGGDAVSPNGGNAQGGWNINGLVYSSFESCSGDNNGGPGWTIKATGGVTMTSCGSEANFGAGFLAISDDLNIDAIPTPGINGLILDGCFAINNGAASPTTPNFLEFRTAGTRAGDIVMRGCYDMMGTIGSLVSTSLAGAGGALLVEETACHFAGTRLKSGNTYTKNSSVVGKTCIVKLAADASAADSVTAAVPFTTFDSNMLAATLSAGGVVIPPGVNRVKLCAGVFWASSSVGSRTVTFYKNGVAFYGGPTQKTTPSGNTAQSVSSAVVGVVAGDIFTVVVFQSSGAALSVIANPNTFLSVEAMG